MLEEAKKAITIPGYLIENEIGKGGMATVYLAIQESLRRRIALKVMSPALTSDQNFAERFLKEGQIVAQLDHQQIVTVFDFGTHQDMYYLSMEYLPGATLEQRIRNGLTSERAVQIIKTIAEALGYAHSQGVLHRDIKPHNILFRRDDRPVLTDFGIARFIDDNVNLTAPGLTVGSPSYMSPERVSGKKIDARADLYSMGVVFYQMLTGKLPYQGDSPISVAIKHCSEPLPMLPMVYGKFQPILNKLLAKEPKERFTNAEAFIVALDNLEIQQPTLKLSQPLPTTTPPKAQFLSYKKGLIAGGLIVTLSASVYFTLINRPFSANSNSSVIDLEALPPTSQERSPIAGRYETLAIETLEEGNLKHSLALIDIGLGSVPKDPRLIALREDVVNLHKANARLEEAQQLQQQGDLQQSLTKIQQGLNLAPNYSKLLELRKTVVSLQIANARLEEAQQLQQQGDLQQSLTKIQQGLEEVPDLLALLELSEKVQTQIANLKKADEILRQAQQQFQNRAYEESLNSIEIGLKLVPDHPELLSLHAKVEAEIHLDQEVDQLVEQAKELEQMGALVDALAILDGVQQQAQNHPRILALRDRVGSALARQQEADDLRQQAKQAWQDGDLAKSLVLIEEGLLLVPEQSDLLSWQEQVKQQLTEQNEIAEILKNCSDEADVDALNSAQIAHAVACYQAVLQRQPNNSEAHQAVQRLADQYAKLTEQAIASGTKNQAKDLLDQLEQLDSTYPEFNSLRERLTRFTGQSSKAEAKDKLATLLRECAAHLAANRLTTGQEGTALECYHQVLAEDPDNNLAQTGLKQIAAKYAGWATNALSRKDFRRAEQHLQRLEKVNPQHPRLTILGNELRALQNAHQRQTEEANRLFHLAQQYYQDGDLDESMALIEQGLRQHNQHVGLVNLKQEIQTKLDQSRQAAAQQQREKADSLLFQAQLRYENGAFEESLGLVTQGLKLAPNHNRLQTLRQEIQAKLAEAAEPASTEKEQGTETPRKRIFGTF